MTTEHSMPAELAHDVPLEVVLVQPPANATEAFMDPKCSVLASTKHGENSLSPTGRTTGFACPNCLMVNLDVGQIGSRVEIGYCPQCYGFVVDSATLGGLIVELRANYQGADDKPNPLNERDLEKRVSCPACGDKMEVHSYCGPGNVVIDSCRHCKVVWFNQGELNRIVRAPGRR